MITLFGIKNCDSVKKARKWLDGNAIDYTYVDFRTDGIDAKTIAKWISPETAATLVNKRSTTWKALNDSEQSEISSWLESAIEGDAAATQELAKALAANVTLIKRPVAIYQQQTTIGFKADEYQRLFA